MATAVARAKHIRISPRKVRLVADTIRGMKVSEARDMLQYLVKGASPVIKKLLDSAVANAEYAATETNQDVDPDEMVVSNIQVGDGPTLRRFRAAARGRATRIRKRSCNINLTISDN